MPTNTYCNGRKTVVVVVVVIIIANKVQKVLHLDFNRQDPGLTFHNPNEQNQIRRKRQN